MTEPEKKYSLRQLQTMVKESLAASFSDFYWITAEISELKINYSGHCYLELIDKNDNEDDISARVRAIIWSKKARFLLSYFENSSGQALSEGKKILIRVSIEYHEVYGLSLIINDIDPAYTIGEQAIKRRKIITQLETEGVMNMNQDLDFPSLPVNIAVISSEKAAGYEDFLNQLSNNPYGYCYKTRLFNSVMQGIETEDSLSRSINQIFERINEFDLIVIVRGGGSHSDLSWFDNYNIAFMITQAPIPVITGIGHERDNSVVDMVAYKSFKTPTAVAEFIIGQTLKTDEHLAFLKDNILGKAKDLLEVKKKGINVIRTKISPLVRLAISKRKSVLNRHGIKLSGSSKSILSQHNSKLVFIRSSLKKETVKYLATNIATVQSIGNNFSPFLTNFFIQKHNEIKSLSRSINYLSPSRVLERGYSITMIDGKAIKSAKMIHNDSEITTLIHDGKIRSRVFDIKKNK